MDELKHDNDGHWALHLTNEMSQIRCLPGWITKVGECAGMAEECIFNLNLALEECVANIICYAYDGMNDMPIDLEAWVDDSCVTVVVSDAGKPFDPTAAPDPDIDVSFEDREIGGLGIFLIRTIAQNVEYRREINRNILTMSFAL